MSTGTSRLVGGGAVEEAVAVVRAKIVVVVVVALLGLAGGVVYGSGQQSKPVLEMRLRLTPISSNSTVVALGVSSPHGPIAADFVDQGVLDELGRDLDRSPAQVEKEISVEGVVGDSEQLILAVPTDTPEGRELLRAWYAAVQVNRRAVLGKAIEDAKAGYLRELDAVHPLRSRREALEIIARLSGLKGSLQTDVSILRNPEVVQPPAHSPLYYGAIGLLIGVVAGIAVTLGLGLLDRKLRTPAALAANFGLPIVADLRRGGGDPAALAERVKIAAGADAAASLVIAEAGPPGSAKLGARALEGVEGAPSPVAVGPVASAETLAALAAGTPWVVAVVAGQTRSDQALEVTAELSGLPGRPLGLVLV